MKIYINCDDFKKTAKKAQKDLIRICDELKIEITENIDEADIVCSIGGDGTLLKSASISNTKPILGINCGTLGFLTEIEPKDMKKALKEILDNNYYIENRMMLEGEIIKANGEKIKIPPALNEVSISKNIYGVVRFDAVIDGKLIAYNLSCGGPIVDPTAEIITLTPIAPHTILNRSIILSNSSIIEIKINELRGDAKAFALYDGNSIEINEKDTVKVKKSDKITQIIKLNWKSFIDIIRENIN